MKSLACAEKGDKLGGSVFQSKLGRLKSPSKKRGVRGKREATKFIESWSSLKNSNGDEGVR